MAGRVCRLPCAAACSQRRAKQQRMPAGANLVQDREAEDVCGCAGQVLQQEGVGCELHGGKGPQHVAQLLWAEGGRERPGCLCQLLQQLPRRLQQAQHPF